MAETSSRLPEEDRPRTRPRELDARERAGGGMRQRGEHLGMRGPGPGGRTRGGQPSGMPSRRRGDHADSRPRSPSRTRGDHAQPGGGFYNPDEGEQPQDEQEQSPDEGLYNDSPEERSGLERLRYRKDGSNRFNFSRRKKIVAAVVSGIISLVVTMVTFFFPSSFTLPNFMKNAEQAGFQRYKVDINTRSTAWLEAYMALRFGEVDDPNLAPGDRDNVFFRAENVKNNQPLRDWYRTMRTSKFEQDVFERRGIKFTSEAYRDSNGVIKFRAAKLTMPDATVRFDPRDLGYNELDALSQADVNKLNGRLQDTLDVDRYGSNKEARAAIKQLVREEQPGVWKAVKRYHLRQDIQNMIGVRKWKFFENTRGKIKAKKVSVRNKIITQSLPENTKSGVFVRCLFGIGECKTSADYANPENNSFGDTGKKKSDGNPNDPNQSEKTYGDPKNPETIPGSTADESFQGAIDAAGTTGKIATKVLEKLNVYNNVLSILDALARFDQALHNHSASLIISQIRSQMFLGTLTTFSVASDNLTTGQVNSEEVRSFMDQFARPTHGEGWTSVVEGQPSGTVSAAANGFSEAKNKKEFCSPQHQALMEKYPKEAELEFQWQCPQDTVGGKNNAQALEDSWNNGAGAVLHPILKVFHDTTGGFFDVLNSISSAIVDPIVNAGLSVTGLQDDVNGAVAYASQEAIKIGGATPPIDDNTPSGQVGNVNIQASAVGGEMSMRDHGGAKTTETARAGTEKDIIAYEQDQAAHTSLMDRYFSPSNPKSLVATQMFAISDFKYSNAGQSLSNVFASALMSPWKVITQPTHADVPDGYAAAKFAKLDNTFDMPPQALHAKVLDETPQNVTNADELGIFKPDELTWDLVSDCSKWYPALYEKVGGDEDKAMSVWNVALMDAGAKTGLGAAFGYKSACSFDDGSGTPSGGGGGDAGAAGAVSGDAQQLAQQILGEDKVSKTGRYVMEDLKHTANGQPAYAQVNLDVKLLQFMAELGQTTPYVITSITGDGCGHSNDTCVTAGGSSNHYIGKAVDFGCGFNEAKADEVAKKYGYMANNERCDHGVDHSHFSPDGY